MFLSGVAFSLVGIASAITAPSWGRFGQEHGFYKALCAATLLSGLMSAVTAMPQEWYRVMAMCPVIPEVTTMLRALSAVTRMQGCLEVTAMPPAL